MLACIYIRAPIYNTYVCQLLHTQQCSPLPTSPIFSEYQACRTGNLSSGHKCELASGGFVPFFTPSKLVHSIYVFLICNPQQRFLALLLEGQGRTTEEQVPGTEPLQSMICQLPPPGICCVLNSKNLFQNQKTHLDLHAKRQAGSPELVE